MTKKLTASLLPLLLCVLAAGCDSDKGSDKLPTATNGALKSAPASGTTCSKPELERFGAVYTKQCALTNGDALAPTDLEMAPGEARSGLPGGMNVVLKAQTMEVEGKPIDGADATPLVDRLNEELSRLAQFAALRKDAFEPSLNLAVAADVDAERVTGFLGIVTTQTKVRKVNFLFDGGAYTMDTEGLDPATRAEVEPLLKGVSPNLRIAKIAPIFQSAVKECPPVHEVIEVLASATPDARCQLLASGLPKALEKCNCATSVPRITTALRLASAPSRRLGYTTVTFETTADGKSPTLAYDKASKWAVAAAAFKAADGKTVRLPALAAPEK